MQVRVKKLQTSPEGAVLVQPINDNNKEWLDPNSFTVVSEDTNTGEMLIDLAEADVDAKSLRSAVEE